MIVPRCEPIAIRFRWSADFQEQRELARVGVLCFIEKDAKIVFPNLARRLGMTHQFQRERDLIVIGEHPALEAELAIIALHFGRDAERASVDPFSRFGKYIFPNRLQWAAFTCRPPNEIVSVAPGLFRSL